MAILKYNGEEIVWQLERRHGMKNIRIRIKSDGSVRVSADTSVPVNIIEDFVRRKADWIYTNCKKCTEYDKNKHIPTLHNGSAVRIFGEKLTVVLVKSGNEQCFRQDNRLFICLADDSDETKMQLLLCSYLAEYGRKVLKNYYDLYYPVINYTGRKPDLTLKMLKSKWGHCDYAKNEIMLNFALCGVPLKLCEYVVVHELVHLLVPNHSPLFYETGSRILPDFRERNKEMKNYSTDLMKNILME